MLNSRAVIRLSAVVVLLPSLLMGMLVITPIARPGQPIPPRAEWAVGVQEIVNHPKRTYGWLPEWSELPNDVVYFELDLKNNADVQECLAKMAAIPGGARLELDPRKEAPSGEIVPKIPSRASGTTAIFSIGNQARLDAWYRSLPEVPPGSGQKKIGVFVYAVAPKTILPTLTLYVGSGAFNLDQLSLPANIEVAIARWPVAMPATNLRYQPLENEIPTHKKIEQFIASIKERGDRGATTREATLKLP